MVRRLHTVRRPTALRLLVVLACLIAASCSSEDGPEAQLDSETTDTTETTRGPGSTQDESGAEPDAGSSEPDTSDRPLPGDAEADDLVAEPSLSDEELSQRLAELDGRLAVGSGPELAVVRPDGARVDLLDGSELVLAAQPTWSHDGQQLAWSSISAERQVVQVQGFDEDGFRSGEPSVADASGNPVFYLQWNDSDDRLAYIRNSAGGSEVEVGVIEPGLPIIPVGGGAPFFISWSPDPDRLLGHVNESSIERYDSAQAGEAGFTTVTSVTGGFSAPVWVDDRRALIVSDSQLLYLDVDTGATETIIDLPGPVRFVLSPDRARLAYQTAGRSIGPAPVVQPVQSVEPVHPIQPVESVEPVQSVEEAPDGLVVLDLETLEQTLVTADVAVAWEWSPDSRSLAWLEAELVGQRPAGRWNFWSGAETPTMARSQWFLFTRKYAGSYLPFFAQYTQSVTGWSPDSSAFAFAGNIGSERGVWIQLVDEMVNPQNIGPGDFVTWGPGQPAPPSQGASAA